MRDTIEEEELQKLLAFILKGYERITYVRCLDCHNKHDPACHNNIDKSDDIACSENIEDNQTSSSRLEISPLLLSKDVEHVCGKLKSRNQMVS